MSAVLWLRGLVRRRPGRLLATAAGVAVAVALLASIGTFLSATNSEMTDRAISRVAVDWQVEAQNGLPKAQLLKKVRSQPGVQRALPVGFAKTTGFSARTGGGLQRTGPGEVLGLPPGYRQAFPGEIRNLAGSGGVLLAQQTAANLQAKVGDSVAIGRPGLPPANVTVSAIVDLPAADSLFQQVGAPVGAQPQAPPDNVILLPAAKFARIASAPGGQISWQAHAKLSHDLPASPSSAYTAVSGNARNLEAQFSGRALVGDNLGTALDQARADALYAQILFLLLGAPGALIAGLLTASIAAAGADRRRRDAALLRTRGATTRELVRMGLAESALAGGLGVVVGLAAALGIGHIAFSSGSFGASTLAAVLWAGGAALAGLTIAAAAIALPAWRTAGSQTVSGQRREIGRVDRAPWWARYGLDLICLGVAAFVYWRASQNGYQLVLAPEGIPQVSVSWISLLAPLLAWIGAGLFAYRLVELALRGRGWLARAMRPVASTLAGAVASTVSRRRRLLARSIALLALTAGFAASTAVFNSTYQQQAEVDARLSNGADVTVTESPGANVGPGAAASLTNVSGVSSVEPLQHRYAYVGSDLQDLYGVQPQSIVSAGKLQDPWFAGGTASGLMQKLASAPDSILVSAETVKDFQLHPGDLLRLRLRNVGSSGYSTVPFHYAGVVKEFPTAPTDSFLVADAGYVAQQTGSDAVGTFLVQTNGSDPAKVADAVRGVVGANAKVSDIVNQRTVIGSNLTAVELGGLTKVELGFALVLAVVASGLALGLSFRERRRTFAIAAAVGARRRQLGGFVWGEALLTTIGGLILGTLVGAGMTQLLINVLRGVFDPPPASLSIPIVYLTVTAALVVAALVAAGALSLWALRRPPISELRDL